MSNEDGNPEAGSGSVVLPWHGSIKGNRVLAEAIMNG